MPDTPVPPAPFPQDVLQASEDMGMNLEELMGKSQSLFGKGRNLSAPGPGIFVDGLQKVPDR